VNVLNVADIERELRRYAARLYHDHAKRWVLTVARNYILGKLPEKDVCANFREVCLCKYTETIHLLKKPRHDRQKHDPKELPPWAIAAVERGETLFWFDTVQPRRRELWNVLEVIILWFNNWKANDTRLPRVDRISFPVATDAAVLWYRDVSANIWNYVTDKPVVIRVYEDYRWVKLVTALQFEREGRLMNHCVGNGSYYNNWRMNSQREYYSLRDQNNKPHATLEVGFDHAHPLTRKGSVHQCKGNGNSKPDRTYQPFIRRFIDDMKWTVTGDNGHID
jgi:hypothetical protein